MRLSPTTTSVVLPGLLAAVIYLVIAFATGASAAPAIIGAAAVAAIATAIGLIFHAFFRRRAASRHE